MEKDLLKYELLDRQAEFADYEFFFRNMNFGLGLEEAIKKHIEKKAKIRVFDLGCGAGNALAGLKRVFGSKVYSIGLDVLPATADGIDEFIQGNALEEKFPNSCDIIVSFRAMHEFGSMEKIIEKVCNSLTPSGKAFLSIRCQEYYNGKVRNLGKIKQKDIEFLHSGIKKGSLFGLKAVGNTVPIILRQGLLNSKGKSGPKSYVAGINLLIEKKGN